MKDNSKEDLHEDLQDNLQIVNKEVRKGAIKTKPLKIDTSNFNEYFMQNFGSDHKFKHESGFFVKHYLKSLGERVFTNDDPVFAHYKEVTVDDLKQKKRIKRDKLDNYRPFKDKEEFMMENEKVTNNCSDKCVKYSLLCKHSEKVLKKMIDKRIKKYFKRKLNDSM